jgi:hypothetical protein
MTSTEMINIQKAIIAGRFNDLPRDTKRCAIKIALRIMKCGSIGPKEFNTLCEEEAFKRRLLDDNFFVLLNNKYGFESAVTAEAVKEYIEEK